MRWGCTTVVLAAVGLTHSAAAAIDGDAVEDARAGTTHLEAAIAPTVGIVKFDPDTLGGSTMTFGGTLRGRDLLWITPRLRVELVGTFVGSAGLSSGKDVGGGSHANLSYASASAVTRVWYGPVGVFGFVDNTWYWLTLKTGETSSEDFKTRRLTAGPGIALGWFGQQAMSLVVSARVAPAVHGTWSSYGLGAELGMDIFWLDVAARWLRSPDDYAYLRDGYAITFAVGVHLTDAYPEPKPEPDADQADKEDSP